MNTSHDRTRVFARVLGPFLVILDVAALLRASDMETLVSDFSTNSVVTWTLGAFVLVGGLIVVALHQYWHGLAAIVVSVLGWLAVVRGVFLLLFPDTFASLADTVVGAPVWWTVACIIGVLIGVYLTYVGWAPEHHPPSAHSTRQSRDVTPAA